MLYDFYFFYVGNLNFEYESKWASDSTLYKTVF